MKIQHRIPVDRLRLSDPVTPEYMAEVDETVRRAEIRYRNAQAAVARAEARAARAEAAMRGTACSRQRRRAWLVAVAELEQRREELARLASLTRAAPASAQHRGDRSYRPVPKPGELL